jgi:glycosyltransferase involved in cell wall biosynthesis
LSRKVLFLTLRIFSGTGGIEKVSKVAGKAIFEIAEECGDELKVYSLYDKTSDADTRYFPKSIFAGFNVRKFTFVVRSVLYGRKCNLVILSHTNLLLAGYLVKILSPKSKLILIAHGIEAWGKFPSWKRKMLYHCDQILAVSSFTKNNLNNENQLPERKLKILNNCLDPFITEPVNISKSDELLNKYGFKKNDIILMALNRMVAEEGYKGYDIVIQSLQKLREKNPNLKYLIVGRYDSKEKARLDKMIAKAGLRDQVIFAGFVPDKELADHFNLADIYIMPSEKEGFGIVFIEAMYYNKPVIAGNRDGSTDALLDGKLGLLVNPESLEEVTCAITRMINHKEQYLPDRELLMENFSFPVYKEKWREVLVRSF